MANVKLGTKAVGSIVKLKVNGAAKEFIVVHQGKPSSLYDESCNGTWLLMKDIYEKRQWNSYNGNKLESSTIHSYLNSTFLNLFDSNIRDAIKQVKIPYRKNGGSGGSDQSGANGLLCKIFLLSGYEVGFTTSISSYFPVDGAKLSYFESGTGTPANNKRLAYLNGSVAEWWLRSPYTNDTSNEWLITTIGGGNVVGASTLFGIRPALILPPDMEVDSSGNVTLPPPATHKTLVNGTTYEVTGGKCMVDGTVYSIKKGRTLIGGTGYDVVFSSVSPILDENDWATIREISDAGQGANYWSVGDRKAVTLNGTVGKLSLSNVTTYAFIIGFNHNASVEGANRIHFQLAKTALSGGTDVCFCDNQYGPDSGWSSPGAGYFVMNASNTNFGGWKSSQMRTAICGTSLSSYSGTIIAVIPAALRAVLKSVTKYTDNTGGGSTAASAVTATTDYFFLLSEYEVFGSILRANSNESYKQAQYAYYSAGNSKIKYKHNGTSTAAYWWLRSPIASYTNRFVAVYADGTVADGNADYSLGFAPGFCV